ncbi:YqeB family protein [Rhodococcoides yunnanense]|uniref:DUF308 domain-containing protein n=1 Tax=Rhodococcoides yunnanense TaxID=278209 RepID=A0ABU4BK46_9NOCA|nr:hypothetical protein [Rhodococcus yunnanensis]MDV6264598.1 hypothetical protein [Rhodococcus yunnanensis]
MTDKNIDNSDATVFGWTTRELVALVAGFALVAGIIGAAVPFVAGWASRLPTDLQPIFELADSYDRWIAVVVFTVVGLVGGAVLATKVLYQLAKITFTDTAIRVERSGSSFVVPRTEVSAVFVDEEQLVVLGVDSGQRIRSDVIRGTADKLRNASRRHGYTWFDQDPHADLFRRWQPDTADLPPAANALLKVRADALEKQSAEELDELGEELQKLGYVVRQTETAQYWRPIVRP